MIRLSQGIDALRQIEVQMTDRSHWTVRKFKVSESGYPPRIKDPDVALGMMWQLTVDAWAMRGIDVSEFRLPRHVVRVIRGKQ